MIKKRSRVAPLQIVDKLIIKAHAVKYITNTAANTFRTGRALIFS